MNNAIKSASRRILQLIISTALFLPVIAWAQKTVEPELRINERHGCTVYSVAFSPDGKTLASAHNDNMIGLWDLKTGRLIRSFVGHTGHVPFIVFSPDGKTLAGGSPDQTVKLWEVSSGRFIRPLTGHRDSIYSVAFSPNGKTLASASNDRTVKLWEVSSGRLVRTFEGHSSFVHSVAFSPDGKTLASGSYDNTLMLWDVSSGRHRTFEGHTEWVNTVAFSPDGKMLASGSTDRSVKLWEVASGNLINSFGNHDSSLYGSLAFSPDEKTLALASYGSIEFWEASAGQRIRSLKGHDKSVTSVAFSPDGKTLASGSYDGTIKIWETGVGNLLATLMRFKDLNKDSNWITFIPGSYYVSSEDVALHISWREGYKRYEADESPGTEFMARFNKPDLVVAGLKGEKVAVVTPSGTSGGSRPDTSGATTAIKNSAKPPVTTESVRPPIKDMTGPKIVITSPSMARGIGVRSGAGKVTVSGRALDDSGVKQVVVQGVAARLDARGNFSAEATLKVGDNLITVTATDTHDNQTNDSFVVRREPAGDPVTANVNANANGARYHALLIAVQEYDHPSVNRLDYPVGDAQQVERELTSRYTFEPQNVTTLKNPDRRTILDALDRMTEKLKPEDNLLIFYAGHGLWDEQRKQGYWLPRDATRDRRADWISNSDLRDAIRGIKARHILLISDACFAGGIFQAREAFGAPSSAVAELDNMPSRTAMTSGVLTTGPYRSVFVEYLLRRLKENTEEQLLGQELFGRLRLSVINNSPAQKDGSRPTPRYGTIFEVGDEGGDFIFVRRR
ncbi:MAG TPA: caspase family protein [Blastocatellia bacterium]|nr:caspase family protein [Blastocatellia bacterium]